MLAAYKSLFHEQANDTRQVDVGAVTTSAGPASSHELLLDTSGTTNNNLSDELPAIRKLLANRLNRHAKLGSEYSRQFLESLKRTFAMDQLEFSRFRALRLIRPTTELSGRFTCSISSLDSDDLRSTNLIVYGKFVSAVWEPQRSINLLWLATRTIKLIENSKHLKGSTSASFASSTWTRPFCVPPGRRSGLCLSSTIELYGRFAENIKQAYLFGSLNSLASYCSQSAPIKTRQPVSASNLTRRADLEFQLNGQIVAQQQQQQQLVGLQACKAAKS